MPVSTTYLLKKAKENYKLNIIMATIIMNNESLSDAGVRSTDLTGINPQSGADEIVLYDECGDTLWDRVLRQKENKLHVPQVINN